MSTAFANLRNAIKKAGLNEKVVVVSKGHMESKVRVLENVYLRIAEKEKSS